MYLMGRNWGDGRPGSKSKSLVPGQCVVMTILPLLLHNLTGGQPVANIQKGEVVGLKLIGVV